MPKLNNKDRTIQSALGHLYEMFDPFRTDPRDIDLFSIHHCRRLDRELKKLERIGFTEQARTIRQEICNIFHDNQDLVGILNS